MKITIKTINSVEYGGDKAFGFFMSWIAMATLSIGIMCVAIGASENVMRECSDNTVVEVVAETDLTN